MWTASGRTLATRIAVAPFTIILVRCHTPSSLTGVTGEFSAGGTELGLSAGPQAFTKATAAGFGLALGVSVGKGLGASVGVALGLLVGVGRGEGLGDWRGLALGVALGVLAALSVGEALAIGSPSKPAPLVGVPPTAGTLMWP